jgi:acetyl esterase/lipase
MAVRVFVLLFLSLFAMSAHAAEIILWPEGVPEPRVPAEPAEQVERAGKDGIARRKNVSTPRLVVYDIPQTDPATLRSAVVVVPGGGFSMLADEHEGSDACKWFNDRGIVSFLCLHRVPTRGMEQPNAGPVLDVQKSVYEVRRRASEYSLDPKKIALLGFSAGGQAAVVAAANPPRFERAEQTVPTRPDAVMLLYPWQILAADGKSLRTDLTIDATTPPMFIAQAADDTGSVPQGSLALYAALLEAKVPAEIHIYAGGGHGFGMRPRDNAPGTSDWPNRALDWLRTRWTPAAASAADAGNPACTDPARADGDFAFQGEYVGEVTHDGQPMRFGVQIIALGDGKFDAVAYPGGLPGDGWTPPNKIVGTGTRVGAAADAVVKLEGVDWGGVTRKGEIRTADGGTAIVVLADGGTAVAKLPKISRKSPTLGRQPPPGAVVIFDGAGPANEAETLEAPRITDDGLLMEGVSTKGGFGDGLWHIEFRLPYQPKDRGQGRGNSGAYVQGCYEVQMLDSFGLEGKNNECGGVYSVKAPSVNMCLPPLEWQTYDIEFTAPRFEGEKKTASPRMTVRHNGVVIQDDVEVPKITPGGPQKQEKPLGPLHLQNHGNPVRYRNIWFVPKP